MEQLIRNVSQSVKKKSIILTEVNKLIKNNQI